MRTLKATPLGPRLPPLAAAEAHSDPPHRRLSGIEPQLGIVKYPLALLMR
eukprot:COSAG06_NODE_1840_length_8239_cov_3.113145_12_plen_49_part_01